MSHSRRPSWLESDDFTAVTARGDRPSDGSWRADALRGSRHSRLVDELRRPLESHDLDRAEAVCGDACRLTLRDFTPALVLLSRDERRRIQALSTYALTLFDFAHQTGLEGERLAAINRWEFELASALDGHPTGQPVFVLLSQIEQERPWRREGFDELHRIARRRSAVPRPSDRRAAESRAAELGSALAGLQLGREPEPSVAEFFTALLRLQALSGLGEQFRRHRLQLPVSEVPESWDSAADVEAHLDRAIIAECRRIAPVLQATDYLREMTPTLRSAARYTRMAAVRLCGQIERLGNRVLETPPRLGILRRLTLLTAARWGTL